MTPDTTASEHADMEVRLVHADGAAYLAVVGTVLDKGEEHGTLAPI